EGAHDAAGRLDRPCAGFHGSDRRGAAGPRSGAGDEKLNLRSVGTWGCGVVGPLPHAPTSPRPFAFPTIFPPVNRGVVVTGASSGIGAAIARHLAARGFRVFGTVRRAEDEVALARDGVTAVRMDVTDAASIARAREQVERALAGAPLVGLVNNAGIP